MSESTLSANNETLLEILNKADILIWSVDSHYNIDTYNAKFREFIHDQLSQDCEIGTNFLKLIELTAGLPASQEWQNSYDEALKGNITAHGYFLAGKYFVVQVHPILSDGMITSAAVYATDVTGQRLAEEEIHLNAINLSAIINHSPLFIWSVDREYRLLAFNRKINELLQRKFGVKLKLGAISLKGFHKSEAAEISNRWKKKYDKALQGKCIDTIENRKGMIIRFSLTPIVDGNSIVGVSVFAEDVTKKVWKEKSLSDALRQLAQSKLMALRSVMNPHFIFHALASIQYFIMEEHPEKALNYLSKFSKLVRSILENSVRNTIKLSEELMQLGYFVELEQLRFKIPFLFIQEVDPSIDTDEIEIPSLLLQPFVENAIQHGLYHKDGKGILKVSVKRDEERILYEIEDNGIGRKASQKLQPPGPPGKSSMGMMITEERLRLINQYSNLSLKVIDLMEHGSAAGTKVKIWLKNDELI